VHKLQIHCLQFSPCTIICIKKLRGDIFRSVTARSINWCEGMRGRKNCISSTFSKFLYTRIDLYALTHKGENWYAKSARRYGFCKAKQSFFAGNRSVTRAWQKIINFIFKKMRYKRPAPSAKAKLFLCIAHTSNAITIMIMASGARKYFFLHAYIVHYESIQLY
jgi:hypothetical protein